MNRLCAGALSLALLSAALAGHAQSMHASPSAAAGGGTVPAIGASDLNAKMAGGHVTVIDVGAKAAYGQAHIPGAVWDVSEEITARNLPESHDDTVVFYCTTDACAQAAAGQASNAGYEHVYVLMGGLDAWKAAGLPVTSAKTR